MTSILNILALGNIPLSRECVQIDYRQQLCDPPLGEDGRDERGATLPVAYLLDKNKTNPARLGVTVDISNLKLGIYTLRGFNIVNQNLLFIGKAKITSKNKNEGKIIFKVSDQIEHSYFHRFEGIIKWQIIPSPKNSNVIVYELEETYFEFFWVHGFNNNLFTNGVPVEILRRAAYAQQITGQSVMPTIGVGDSGTEGTGSPLRDPVITAIANICFLQNPPKYNANSYLGRYNDLNNIIFYLRRYLNSISDSNAKCNCYDMAAVVQLHLKAVGIEDVKFCYMKTFGYIRLTKLIGFGFCNSPGDNDLIVDPHSRSRKKFESHAFCCLSGTDGYFKANDISPEVEKKIDSKKYKDCACKSSTDCRILDACIGPHCGNENISEYLNNTLDKECPDNNCPLRSKVEIYEGVKSIDFNARIMEEPKLPHLEAFKNAIRYPDTEEGTSTNTSVVNNFNPNFVIDTINSPEFKKWEVLFEDIIPGASEVLKTWILRKKCGSFKLCERNYICENIQIQIDVHVFSDSNVSNASQAAKFRFLALGSGSTYTEIPYKKGPSYLGKYSAVCDRKTHCQYLWTDQNVIIHVLGHNTPSCEIKKLCKKLASNFKDNIKRKSDKKEIGRALPVLPENKNPIKIKIMGNAIVETKSTGDVFMDFVFEEGDGIRLIKKQDNKLTFIGLKKSTNVITVAVVDKNTLLTNSKQITIEVEG